MTGEPLVRARAAADLMGDAQPHEAPGEHGDEGERPPLLVALGHLVCRLVWLGGQERGSD